MKDGLVQKISSGQSQTHGQMDMVTPSYPSPNFVTGVITSSTVGKLVNTVVQRENWSQSGDWLTSSAENWSQSGDRLTSGTENWSQTGDRLISGTENWSQSGDWLTSGTENWLQSGNRLISGTENWSQSGDRLISDTENWSRELVTVRGLVNKWYSQRTGYCHKSGQHK